ncbi:hypothetical protein [Paenibacillus hexagrammi]|nr:hypothetical protein [Paenibacillus sp. YPD9-1]
MTEGEAAAAAIRAVQVVHRVRVAARPAVDQDAAPVAAATRRW